MATVFRKTYTKPMPEGVGLLTRKRQRFARWKDGRGRIQRAELSEDGRKVVIESPVWYASYRDADGVERRVSTGCRDEQTARQVLADLLAEARAERKVA